MSARHLEALATVQEEMDETVELACQLQFLAEILEAGAERQAELRARTLRSLALLAARAGWELETELLCSQLSPEEAGPIALPHFEPVNRRPF